VGGKCSPESKRQHNQANEETDLFGVLSMNLILVMNITTNLEGIGKNDKK
jgi:hypothetical protein